MVSDLKDIYSEVLHGYLVHSAPWWTTCKIFNPLFFCLSGPDISTDQEDYIENPSHFLPHGHCDRVGHGNSYGGKKLAS